MKTCRTLVTSAVLFAGLVLTGGVAHAQTCQPGIGPAFGLHPAAYTTVLTALAPQVGNLTNGLASVVNQATYATYLADARTLASSIPNGRLLVSLPDGTVVLDTARTDDPTNVMPVGNSYQHFQDKTVNENHNSRLAIFLAQEYPCGFALESKLSTTTGFTESYVAARLGPHTDSLGTARLSTR